MPDFPTKGQFGGSPYDNPQMGQWGGGNPWGGGGGTKGGFQGRGYGGYGRPDTPEGWHGDSPMEDWRAGITPDQFAWQGGYGSGTPGHMGQEGMWNPYTGQMEYVDDPSGLAVSGQGGRLSWIDPETGMRTINPFEMQKMMGGMGGGGGQGGGYQYQGYSPSSYEGGQVTPGGGYGGFDYSSVGSGVDPSAVIASQEAGLQERMEGDMARAGGRAGQSGFAMSTPYMGQLGEAARKASQDRTALTMQYQYDAAQAQAQRDQQQQMQAAQLGFGGWQQGYQGDLQAQMFNQGQGMQQWMAENQMGMQGNQMQNQYGFANWQNQQNQQNQQNALNQQLMASLMGGLW